MQAKYYLQKIKETPYISICIAVINAIVFLMCTFSGRTLYEAGGLSPELFLIDGQYYRIFSAMFLHADIYHIVNNMLLLVGIGTMLEKEIGHVGFLVAYLLSGIGGQVVSLAYKVSEEQWWVSSVGASGAVFGLVGVLLAMSIFFAGKMQTVTWQKILIVIAYSIYSGVQAANIDNAAHLGGFVTGFVLGMIVCVVRKMREGRNFNRQ